MWQNRLNAKTCPLHVEAAFVLLDRFVLGSLLPFCRTEHQMVTMRTQMTVKTSSARTPPITAYGTALWVSTTAPGSEKEQQRQLICGVGVWDTQREIRREREQTETKRDTSNMKEIKVRERKRIKMPAWERAQGVRQEKRKVDIVRPTCIITFSSPPAAQNIGWKKGEELRRVNKEIGMSASKKSTLAKHLSRAQCIFNEGNLCLHPS